MINKKYFFKTGKGWFLLDTVLVIALIEFMGVADGQIRITVPLPVVVVAPPVVVVAPPVVVVPDNYVYYPSYGIYFNTSRQQYAYLDGGAWVTRSAPMGVSVDVLLASPSVKMDFHDSPANHHAAMLERYPKNFKGGRADQKAEGHEKAENHEEHGEHSAHSEHNEHSNK